MQTIKHAVVVGLEASPASGHRINIGSCLLIIGSIHFRMRLSLTNSSPPAAHGLSSTLTRHNQRSPHGIICHPKMEHVHQTFETWVSSTSEMPVHDHNCSRVKQSTGCTTYYERWWAVLVWLFLTVDDWWRHTGKAYGDPSELLLLSYGWKTIALV